MSRESKHTGRDKDREPVEAFFLVLSFFMSVVIFVTQNPQLDLLSVCGVLTVIHCNVMT